ncbi:MAG: sugar ABC transporter permease [Bacillales bacterium]|jgi:multiple sugar transport system permease protein|nr:sugar ABC transporter permease [Bacillales bacterium]
MEKVTVKSSLFKKEKLVAILFIALPLIGFLLFTVFSIIATGVLSFTNYDGIRDIKFVGFKNYSDLFTHQIFKKAFWTSVLNTLFLLIGMPIGMVFGVILATFLNSKKIKGKKFFRVLFYFPAISGAVAINIIWRYIFNNEYGVVRFLFGKDVYWLSNPILIKVAIIIKGVWNGLGGTMLLYLAGMQGIAPSLYEAADIDGASDVQKFFHVTLPLLTPVTFYLLVTGLINGLQSYADSQVFAQGDPGAQTIVYFIWERGIHQARYGLASSASILLSIVVMIITVINFKFSNRWVYEN